MEVEFNVNQIVSALKRYSGYDIQVIKSANIASISNQWDPEMKRIGVGGVLTVVCEVSEKRGIRSGRKKVLYYNHSLIKIIKVHCSKCDEWIEEGSVQFLNIEEDIEGKDVLTFRCPQCKTKQRSHRVG